MYTEEQFQELAQYEEQFRRAVNSNFARNPGRDHLVRIRSAYMEATGTRWYPENYGCTACIVQLLKDAGRLWLDQKAEMEKEQLAKAQEQEAVAKTIESAKKPAKSGTKSGIKSTKTAKAKK